MVGIVCSGEHAITNAQSAVYDPKVANFRDRYPAMKEYLFNLELKFRNLSFPVRWVPLFFRFM